MGLLDSMPGAVMGGALGQNGGADGLAGLAGAFNMGKS